MSANPSPVVIVPALRPPSGPCLAAIEELHTEKLRRITSGEDFLSSVEEARILERHWFAHRSEMERTLEAELHTANQQLARALSKPEGARS